MSSSPGARRVVYRHEVAYEVVKTARLFAPDNPALLSGGRVENARRFVVIDGEVARQHAGAAQAYFAHHRVEAKIVTLPGGEENKSVEAALALARELDAFPIHRRDEPVIAIGGGVLTDLVGCLASVYRRGVPHIRVPTTLMGYVDAAIGIKTGFNFNGNKNRLGSFAPPLKVLLDRAFLLTLPERHIRNGVCEIIKLAVIRDAALFRLLEEHGMQSIAGRFQDAAGDRILDRAIDGMLEELQPDFYEENLSRRVDFGHTFSYGLETRCEGRLFHGEAVLLDVALSALIAEARSLLQPGDTGRIFRLAERLGIPLDTEVLDPGRLWASLLERTYHRNGLQRVPMPCGIGCCTFVNDIRPAEIETAVRQLQERAGAPHGITA